jgi:hypothetical protein
MFPMGCVGLESPFRQGAGAAAMRDIVERPVRRRDRLSRP